MKTHSIPYCLALSLVVTFGLLGCSSGEKRYRVSGSVTFKGKPVPEGYIVFEPDSSKGNQGGPGRAKILDGKYDTSEGENVGVLGGPHLIIIQGFDKMITGLSGQEVTLPKSLFTDYRVSVDLPKKDGVMDFEVK